MIHLGVCQIPEFNIRKRWTKTARDILGPVIESPLLSELALPNSFRHNIMYVSALELVKMGDADEGKYHIVMKHITAAKKELRLRDTPAAPLYYSSGGEDDVGARKAAAKPTELEGLANTGAMTSDGVITKEPLVKRGRGRPKATRFKSFLDGGGKKNKMDSSARPDGLSKQTKFCKRCRKPGHNSSSCTVDLGDNASTSYDQVAKKPRKKNRCRKCNGLGHNSATCTAEFRNDDADGEDE
jgi:hypothetical protein